MSAAIPRFDALSRRRRAGCARRRLRRRAAGLVDRERRPPFARADGDDARGTDRREARRRDRANAHRPWPRRCERSSGRDRVGSSRGRDSARRRGDQLEPVTVGETRLIHVRIDSVPAAPFTAVASIKGTTFGLTSRAQYHFGHAAPKFIQPTLFREALSHERQVLRGRRLRGGDDTLRLFEERDRAQWHRDGERDDQEQERAVVQEDEPRRHRGRRRR